MPAAVAVPAIASVVGGGISALAQHKTASNAAKQAQSRLDQANQVAGQDYQTAMDWRNQLMGGQGLPGQIFQQAMGPQTSTSAGSSSFNQVSDSSGTSGLVKTPELLGVRTAQQQLEGGIPSSLSGMLQQQFNQIAGQQEADTQALRNKLVATGANPNDVAAAMVGSPAARNAAQSRLGAIQGVNQELWGRQNQALAQKQSIEQMLADQFQNQHTTSSGTSRSNQTNVGPGNALAALGLLAPPQRQVYV